MQQSNGYIIGFTVGMTVICAVLLAGLSEYLKPLHKMQEEIDTKTNIYSAYEAVPAGADIQALYDANIEGVVVNIDGQLVEADANKINARVEFKKKNPNDKLFPVFKFKDAANPGQYKAYIIPVFGNGLWDEIWGFVAVGPDFNTILGTSFDHKGETPGLGARITTDEFEARFKGKQLFDGSGALKSVKVLKGEGNAIAASQIHEVDGLSGASMTTNGVNDMLSNYFSNYKAFFEASKKN